MDGEPTLAAELPPGTTRYAEALPETGAVYKVTYFTYRDREHGFAHGEAPATVLPGWDPEALLVADGYRFPLGWLAFPAALAGAAWLFFLLRRRRRDDEDEDGPGPEHPGSRRWRRLSSRRR